MSSGLRLRRPVFFCRRTPLSCLSSPHRSLPRLSSRLPFFSCRPAFPTARISHCPCFSLSVSPSARISPALSGRPPSSVFRLVFLLSFLVFPFIVHRSPLVVRRPLRRPSSSACRLLSVARPAAPLSAAVRSGSRLLYPRNPGLRVFGSCLPCRVPSVGLSAKMPPPSVPWSPRRF